VPDKGSARDPLPFARSMDLSCPTVFKRVYLVLTSDLAGTLTSVLIAVGAAVTSVAVAPGAVGFLGAGLALLTVAIANIDRRTFTIPDILTATLLALAFVHAAVKEPEAVTGAVAFAAMRGMTLALAFLAVRSAYRVVRKRDGIGLGDVKLAGAAGAWLDWSMLAVVVELATIAALGAYLLRQFVLGQPISVTSRLPFGMFFAPAIWICWLFENTLAPR
jgi:leader peptidase (prepilin peptidase)/N-methyltransferase